MNRRETKDFLKTIKAKEAFDLIMDYGVRVEKETVSIEEALGRILGEDIISGENLPPHPRSLVDGYALKSKDTYGASESSPVLLLKRGSIKVGERPELNLSPGECVYLSTGSLIPDGADSVLMQEFAREENEFVEITRPVHMGENVLREGEDIKRGDLVLRNGEELKSTQIAILASLGITEVRVYRKIEVGILSTGDEIVSPYDVPELGKVRDINGYLLKSLFLGLGAKVRYAGIARDDVLDLKEKLESILNCDLICVSGGSSKGERDLIVDVIGGLGGKLFFHGVSIRPGKPFFFSIIHGKPLFGLPGHPLSMWLVTQRFVLPLFYKIQGRNEKEPRFIFGRLLRSVPSSYGIEEYINVKVNMEEDDISIEPLFAKSGMISVLLSSTGYIVIDEKLEGLEKGEKVKAFLYDL